MNSKQKKLGVSAVIPSFNNKKCLFRLLNSLKKNNYKPLEVIVVDNSPTKQVLHEGKKKFKWVKWIDAGTKNIGQAMTYNIGFAHANKKHHILFIDEDVVADIDLVKNLVERARVDKKIGIVTPMILYLNDKNWVNQAGSKVNLLTGKVTVGWGQKAEFMKAMEVQGSGTVMLFTRDLVNKIGGFEDWFLCYFDPEYCLRARDAGFKAWYEPKAVAYHDQSKDPEIWRPRVLSRAYLLGRNRTLFMRKYGNMLGYSLFVPVLLTYYLAETVRYGIFPKWLDLVRGTIVGYFYPISKNIKIDLPNINSKQS